MNDSLFPSDTEAVNRTVLSVDLAGYSDVLRLLEEQLGVGASAMLNRQIAEIVNAGATALGGHATEIRGTGDGALVVVETPEHAHVFAEAVQTASGAHNLQKEDPTAKRWFRIGAATGRLAQSDLGNMAGMVIARAVRLESKSDLGGLLIDRETYQNLPAQLQAMYGPEEMIAGKEHDQPFPGYRRQIIPVPSKRPPAAAPPAQSDPSGSDDQNRGAARQDRDHVTNLITIKIRRLQILELQKAQLGPISDPSIELEIEDLRQEISELRNRLDAGG